MLLPVREELQNPISLQFISLSKHSDFENRTESGRVQSSGEELAIRRRMSRLCRLGVRSSNEKSMLLLG